MVMCDNDDIGPRVIQAIPDDCYDDKRSIRFVLCGRVGDMNCRKVFDVFFKDNDEYIEWAGKLFINTIENGKTDKTSRYRFVLIHGEWNAMPIDACQTCCNKQCDGKWICTGYQYSYYCSSRQILCPKDQQIIK